MVVPPGKESDRKWITYPVNSAEKGDEIYSP